MSLDIYRWSRILSNIGLYMIAGVICLYFIDELVLDIGEKKYLKLLMGGALFVFFLGVIVALIKGMVDKLNLTRG